MTVQLERDEPVLAGVTRLVAKEINDTPDSLGRPPAEVHAARNNAIARAPSRKATCRAADSNAPSVRARGVTFGGEITVACEATLARRTGRDDRLAVDVVFAEDARGMLEIVSWNRGESVADALTTIAVGYLSSALASGAFAPRGTAFDRPGSWGHDVRLEISTTYLRDALTPPAVVQANNFMLPP